MTTTFRVADPPALSVAVMVIVADAPAASESKMTVVQLPDPEHNLPLVAAHDTKVVSAGRSSATVSVDAGSYAELLREMNRLKEANKFEARANAIRAKLRNHEDFR